jgi:hypothetical protein
MDETEMFSLICGIQAQYKYKQYYIYIQIYMEHVPKSETGEGDEGMKKSKKERKTANNNEIHHICVATRHMEAQ